LDPALSTPRDQSATVSKGKLRSARVTSYREGPRRTHPERDRSVGSSRNRWRPDLVVRDLAHLTLLGGIGVLVGVLPAQLHLDQIERVRVRVDVGRPVAGRSDRPDRT
jgi:hypothetical protein